MEEEVINNQVPEEKKKNEEHKMKKKDKNNEALLKQIEDLNIQLGMEKDRALRIQAEMVNFRKRKEEDSLCR